jgi:hypothetical protein
MMKKLINRIAAMIENGSIKEQKKEERLEFLLRTKRWNPYCLRHSAITYDSDYLPDYAIKKKVRWSINSRQGSRYIKAKMGSELKRTILAQNGISMVGDEAFKLSPSVHVCPRCNLVNTFENKYCSKCSYPLVPSAFEEIKQAEDSKIQHMMQEHFQELRDTTQAKDEEIRLMKQEFEGMRSKMNDIVEILKIAKSEDGKTWPRLLDEKRRVAFGYVNSNKKIAEVKIAVDGVEIEE